MLFALAFMAGDRIQECAAADWFLAPEGPSRVAIIGVLTAIVVAMGPAAVAAINNARAGGGREGG